jgi:ribosome-binding protein aMBF1 (putative translation factor)
MRKRKRVTPRPTRPVSPDIGLRIAARRKQLEWTREMLATATGTKVMRVYRIERGDVHVLAEEVTTLSAVLGMSVNELLYGADAASSSPVGS